MYIRGGKWKHKRLCFSRLLCSKGCRDQKQKFCSEMILQTQVMSFHGCALFGSTSTQQQSPPWSWISINYQPLFATGILGCFLLEKLRLSLLQLRQASVMHEPWPWLWFDWIGKNRETLDFCRWKFKMIYYSLCKNVFGMFMQRLYGVWTNHEPMHQVFMTPNDSKWVAFFAATTNGGHENLGSQSDNLRCKFRCFLFCYSKKSDGNDPGTHFGGDFLGPQVLNLPSCSQTEAMDAEGFFCPKVFATLNKHIAAR